jgi:hypothetical protein
MHIRTKLLMAVITAALAMTMFATAASALRSLEVGTSTRLVLTGRVTFTGGEIRVICNTTFEKTLNRAIAKTVGAKVGQVTRVAVEACRAEGGGAERPVIRILNEGVGRLWEINYKSFEGNLPNEISGITYELRNTQVLLQISIFGVAAGCLYEGTVGVHSVIAGRVIGRLTTTSERPETVEVGLRTDLTGFGACPRRGRFTASVEPTVRTTVTLV